MATVRNVHIGFSSTAITNELLELGVWNFV